MPPEVCVWWKPTMSGSPDIRTRAQPVRISVHLCTDISTSCTDIRTTCIRIQQRPPAGNLNLLGVNYMHMHMHTALVQRTFRIENLSFPPSFCIRQKVVVIDGQNQRRKF